MSVPQPRVPAAAPVPETPGDTAPKLLANPRRRRLAHVRSLDELRELVARDS